MSATKTFKLEDYKWSIHRIIVINYLYLFYFACLCCDIEEHSKRERFAVSQQIVVDDQVRAERINMLEREKAEFFKAKSPQEDDKQPSGTPHIEDIAQEKSGDSIKPETDESPSEHKSEPLSKLTP